MANNRLTSTSKRSLNEAFEQLIREAAITRSECIRYTRLRHKVLWLEEQQPVKYLFLCLVETLAHHTQHAFDDVEDQLKALRDSHLYFTQQERKDWLVQTGLLDG